MKDNIGCVSVRQPSLADIIGIETIKTLVGAMSVPDFTVDELAKQTGVSRRTIDTVLRRYEYAFERLPSIGQVSRGRPPVRWRLRSDHLDEVVAAVESHQSALSVGWRAEVAEPPRTDMAEASLIMAAAAIAHLSEDAQETEQLLVAARHSLAAAGFNRDGSPWGDQPNDELSDKARLVATVADVVEACVVGDQQRIDEAQARALPQVVLAARRMAAAEWLPLAQRAVLAPGTVLSAPVLVAKPSLSFFKKLFPTLRSYTSINDVPSGFVPMTDTRVEQPTTWSPVTSLMCFQDRAETMREFAHAREAQDYVVISPEPEVLVPVLDHGAHFILHRDYAVTKTEIANIVNRRACGFDVSGRILPRAQAAEDPYNLHRFVAAQDAGGTYDQATAELISGRKTSHWMWFIFPQIAGLGYSPASRTYAITSLEEARSYLAHPVLGPRLIECAAILTGMPGRNAEQIFGEVDALKLRSSITLFIHAAPGELVFRQVLDKYFDGVPDSATEQRI